MLREMECVYAVYQERNFSRAAKKLFISQPALSTTIKKLEAELGVLLFDRSTTPIGLTQAGEYYIQSLEKIMAIQRDMTAYFDNLGHQSRGRLRLGSSTYCCTYVLPDIIQEFNAQYPQTNVELIEAPSVELVRQLNDGTLDFLLDAGSAGDENFNEVPFANENLILSVPSAYCVNEELAAHRLPYERVASGQYLQDNSPSVGLECFSEESFLFLKKGNDMFTRGLAMCKEAGFEPKISMYVDQMLTAYYLSCEGKGCAFIRDSIIERVEKTSRICLYKIESSLAVRQLIFAYKKYPSYPLAMEHFLKFIQHKSFD